MNTNIVLSVLECKIHGAYVYHVDRDNRSSEWCVLMLPGGGYAKLWSDEHVFIETLIIHAMYNRVLE